VKKEGRTIREGAGRQASPSGNGGRGPTGGWNETRTGEGRDGNREKQNQDQRPCSLFVVIRKAKDSHSGIGNSILTITMAALLALGPPNKDEASNTSPVADANEAVSSATARVASTASTKNRVRGER
jgi:hypothetical protein